MHEIAVEEYDNAIINNTSIFISPHKSSHKHRISLTRHAQCAGQCGAHTDAHRSQHLAGALRLPLGGPRPALDQGLDAPRGVIGGVFFVVIVGELVLGQRVLVCLTKSGNVGYRFRKGVREDCVDMNWFLPGTFEGEVLGDCGCLLRRMTSG